MIDGVVTKKLKVMPDERGRLMEMLRCDDPFFEQFGQVYMTTSRRTPPAAEGILKDALSDRTICPMFVSGRDDRSDNTVEKILALSDVVIVSGESISMVSEAVSSGRPVLVFMPDKRSAGETKYDRFVKGLADIKCLRLVSPGQIPDAVNEALREGAGSTVPDDDKKIYDQLHKLF